MGLISITLIKSLLDTETCTSFQSQVCISNLAICLKCIGTSLNFSLFYEMIKHSVVATLSIQAQEVVKLPDFYLLTRQLKMILSTKLVLPSHKTKMFHPVICCHRVLACFMFCRLTQSHPQCPICPIFF